MRLVVVNPCPMAWEELVGDGSTRFCEKCKLHVTDLASMPPECAADFVRAKKASGERVCGRLPVVRPLLAAAAVAIAGCTAEVGPSGPVDERAPAAAPAPPDCNDPANAEDPACDTRGRFHELGDVEFVE